MTDDDATGAGVAPRRRVRFAAVHQRWASVAFVHWRYETSDLRQLAPRGTEIAERNGSAWVSMVLFRAERTRGPLPFGPSLPPFGETNLRTYLRLADGREAIWFLSLEARSVATCVGGRAGYGVPYHRSTARVEAVGGGWRYAARRPRTGIGHDLTIVPRADATRATGDLDVWLTGRWRAHTEHLGTSFEVMVEHPPWALRPAVVETLDENLLAAVGLSRPPAPSVVHVGDDVDIRLGLPGKARSGRGPVG